MLGIFKSKKIPMDKIETVIGSNTSFDGHLKCDGNIRIDGVCEGGIIGADKGRIFETGMQKTGCLIQKSLFALVQKTPDRTL